MSRKLLVDELNFKPKLTLLDDAQLDALYRAVLDLLENTGVGMTHPQGLEIMAGAGCKVDRGRVRIPPELVEKALSTVRKELSFGNREGSRAFTMGPSDTYFGATVDCVNYLNPESAELSECQSPHVEVMTRLSEQLSNYDWIMTLGIARDMPEAVADKCVARIALEHCAKPVIVSANDAISLKEMYEMAVLCRGDEASMQDLPLMGTLNCTIPPLSHDDHLVGKNIYAAEAGIPIVHYSGMQLGGTFPATYASGIVVGSAESLSGLVMQQAINPGAPFVFGSFLTIMDMRTTVFSYGAIEMAMMVGGMSQLAQKMGLPFFGTAGCTDAKEVDVQAAVEGSLQDLVMATVGGGMVHDTHCWLDHGNTISPAYLVIGQEILSMVKQVEGGITVSEEKLALELIDKVGPAGNFLMEPHTMQNFKSVFYPEIMQRTKAQSPGSVLEDKIEDRLKAKALELMSKPAPNPLPEEVAAELKSRQDGWVKA